MENKTPSVKTIVLDDTAPDIRVTLTASLAKKILADLEAAKAAKDDASAIDNNTIEVIEVKDKNQPHDKPNSVGHN